MKLIPGQTPTGLVLFGGILLASTLCPPLLTGSGTPAIAIELVRSIPSLFAGLVANDMGELAKRLEHKDATNHDKA
ncbi:hypothetical protein [Baaleninema sp.]|uniref:hypothetical protein n=1 Tax=Baaleninema sp. TaxID=3101197 RepID=UPI003D01F22B